MLVKVHCRNVTMWKLQLQIIVPREPYYTFYKTIDSYSTSVIGNSERDFRNIEMININWFLNEDIFTIFYFQLCDVKSQGYNFNSLLIFSK